jgi:hypothetical protein
MVARVKLYLQHDQLEQELEARIVPHLARAALGENDWVFCAADFNPVPRWQQYEDAETASLITLGRQILGLKAKLGEPDEGSIAEQLCVYCRLWAAARGDHRAAAQTLAQRFLSQISAANRAR